MATKSQILSTYRTLLLGYPWASDAEKLERFMLAAENTLRKQPNKTDGIVDHHGHNWKLALERCGLFSAKDQALKRLRALPD